MPPGSFHPRIMPFSAPPGPEPPPPENPIPDLAVKALMVEMLPGRLSPRYSAAASGWSFERSRPPREIFATSLRSAITLTPSQQG